MKNEQKDKYILAKDYQKIKIKTYSSSFSLRFSNTNGWLSISCRSIHRNTRPLFFQCTMIFKSRKFTSNNCLSCTYSFLSDKHKHILLIFRTSSKINATVLIPNLALTKEHSTQSIVTATMIWATNCVLNPSMNKTTT